MSTREYNLLDTKFIQPQTLIEVLNNQAKFGWRVVCQMEVGGSKYILVVKGKDNG